MSDIKLPMPFGYMGKTQVFSADQVQQIVEADRAARMPMTDEQLRDALRTCPNDTVENLRVRWLYAKDFAHAIERHHGIRKEQQ